MEKTETINISSNKEISTLSPGDLLSKSTLLDIFRSKILLDLSEIQLRKPDRDKKLKVLKASSAAIMFELKILIEKYESLGVWNKSQMTNALLLANYVQCISLIEMRNEIWPYDYMSFSRRIGEFWENFCKLVWEYPAIEGVEAFLPPSFEEVSASFKIRYKEVVDDLKLDEIARNTLVSSYESVWSLLGSGDINLKLDLHLKINQSFHSLDFKSGFSSNEKGNTNRLLLIGSIYNMLGKLYSCEILVRTPESENNHYLQKLKNSKYWTVYCASDMYKIIFSYSGFNLGNWINEHVNWDLDLARPTLNYLENNDLLRFLDW